ncbi:cytochrome P450 [Polynucleobacter sp. Ross1-W9]|uniref:cytochrome P450 n=1 Tax=Polynucleobacter parvulilacunae TaxID=1855631 RepID=UPI001C0ADD88|nr:cytochrome P450 [Polynucleobacter parvulilacunae]MBU3557633.1 cytochrome P450 [Polynucleobacter parvulilacunae]
MVDKGNFLSRFVVDLYRRAAGNQSSLDLPIRVIDSPIVADEIFKNLEKFIKNYAFFEKLSKGRLSTSGDMWEKRARLTQAFYHQSTHKITDEEIIAIYRRNLRKPFDGELGSLRKALIQSATEVIFLSYGFRPSFPWSEKIAQEMIGLLRDEQIEAWINPLYGLDSKNTQLQEGYLKIKELWQQDLEAKEFLGKLTLAAYDIPGFDAVGELIQNVFAAIETTASAVMWSIDVLGRNPDYLNALIKDVDGLLDVFLDEVLRLYPPLPFVTRVAISDCTVRGVEFKKGEHIVISIVGINCHRDYWSDPLQFKFPRDEFVNGTYDNIAYRPFISGPRVCAGMKLAKRELKSALLVALQLFNIKEIKVALSLDHGLTCMPRTPLENYLERIS